MALKGSLKLMPLADAPPLACLQGLTNGQLQDDQASVRQYEPAYALVVSSANSPAAPLAFVESVAEGYEHEAKRS